MPLLLSDVLNYLHKFVVQGIDPIEHGAHARHIVANTNEKGPAGAEP
jgi:hypothetical protein